MPTTISRTAARAAAARRLSWPDTARLLFLLARMRWFDRRLHALVDRGAGLHDDRLLRLARRWLALHERIGALLPKAKEPEHVRQVRAILAGPDQTPATVDRTRRAP